MLRNKSSRLALAGCGSLAFAESKILGFEPALSGPRASRSGFAPPGGSVSARSCQLELAGKGCRHASGVSGILHGETHISILARHPDTLQGAFKSPGSLLPQEPGLLLVQGRCVRVRTSGSSRAKFWPRPPLMYLAPRHWPGMRPWLGHRAPGSHSFVQITGLSCWGSDRRVMKMTREALELAREATSRWPAMGSVEYTKWMLEVVRRETLTTQAPTMYGRSCDH